MKRTYVLALPILAATLLAGCGSSGSKLADAVVPPNKPRGNYLVLKSVSRSLDIKDNEDLVISDNNGNKQTIDKNGEVDIKNTITNRLTSLNYEIIHHVNGEQVADGKGELLIYKQNNSAVWITKPYEAYPNTSTLEQKRYNMEGIETPNAAIPNTGKITYNGKAFTGQDDQNGRLSYTIDFADKKGSGHITGLKGGFTNKEILLKEKSLSSDISGNYRTINGGEVSIDGVNKGHYDLGIFGQNAEEIAGTATADNDVIGFVGTK